MHWCMLKCIYWWSSWTITWIFCLLSMQQNWYQIIFGWILWKSIWYSVDVKWRQKSIEHMRNEFEIEIFDCFPYNLRSILVFVCWSISIGKFVQCLVIMCHTRVAKSIKPEEIHRILPYPNRTVLYRSLLNSIYRQCNLRKSLDDILSSTFITAVSTWYIVCLFVSFRIWETDSLSLCFCVLLCVDITYAFWI